MIRNPEQTLLKASQIQCPRCWRTWDGKFRRKAFASLYGLCRFCDQWRLEQELALADQLRRAQT